MQASMALSQCVRSSIDHNREGFETDTSLSEIKKSATCRT